MSIGARIKEQRNILKLTQPQLADKLEMSLDSIKKLETDRVKPSIETLIKLCYLFNCSADYILENEETFEKKLVDGFKKMNDIDKQRVIDIIQRN